MVRLLTINACNAYITSGVLSLTGGFQDPRLLLPGWIGIATVRCLLTPLTSHSPRLHTATFHVCLSTLLRPAH